MSNPGQNGDSESAVDPITTVSELGEGEGGATGWFILHRSLVIAMVLLL